MFNNSLKLEHFLHEDIKMTSIYITGYTCRRDKTTDNLEYYNSEYHNLNMGRNQAGNALANVLFKNHSYLYSPRSEREPKENILKLNAE